MIRRNRRLASRRQFLRGTASAVLALAATQAHACSLVAPPPADESRKVGFAIVGLGGFALNQLIPAFSSCRHAKLVALVSGDKQKAKQVAAKYGVAEKNVYGYDASFDSIKDNPEIDVAYIVLPNGQHAEFTVRAAKAGKHVLCEKPMANTVEECQQMIDACKQANRKLMIDYCCQYDPVNLEAIRILRSGEIGRLRMFTGDYGFHMNDAAAWRLNRKLAGGGPLMDIGIYLINGARYITGEEPIEVNGFTFSPNDDPRFKEVEATCVWNWRTARRATTVPGRTDTARSAAKASSTSIRPRAIRASGSRVKAAPAMAS
jgi:predicted dehydrogenase